ncbi:DNA-binding MarR family transcriptional regulator [Conyzicola lurida]|uniref:DNA-binding MarR family transcriptional regulator n=1 Tax=Conyzicola lurida TaxID=1172621 RepID=A0A841APZ1_9MICO|nr:MarR family transcriptional regulator [Conyzicola lurida]MBB5844368.1 DNA-binding MarR family transcriptional regulator [Conyzicola lurida]
MTNRHPDPDGSGGTNSPLGADVLLELVAYRSAEEAMRRRTGDSMHMGATDLQAIRFLLKRQGQGISVSGRELGDYLGMTSASVTSLLDRLTASGHVARTPDPANRRSNLVTATAGSDDEVRQTLGAMHARMIEVTRSLKPEDAALVASFLTSMTAAVDAVDRDPAAA